MKKWLNLENLIYLTILALPTYLIRLMIFGVPTNILEILISIIFVWWLVETQFIASQNLKTPRRGVSTETLNNKYLISIGLIFSGLIISTMVNKDYTAGLGIIKSWFFFPVLCVFIVFNYIPKNKLINIFRALYASAFLVALISLDYLFLGHITYDGRLEGIFNSPNYLAMYLAPGIIIGIIMLAPTWNMKHGTWSAKINKKIFYIFFAIILIAFYFTYSYAAWTAVIISLAAVFLIKNKNVGKKIMVLSAFVFLLVAILFTQLYSDKFNNLLFNNRSSFASRIMIWQSAGKILSDNWLFGIGPGNFQEMYLEYQKYFPPYLEWAVPHPHNIYLTFWLYSGLIGLIGFILLIFFWFRDVIKKDNDLIKFIVLGLMTYILINGLVDTTYFKNDLAIIFWLNFLALKK